MNDSKLHVEGSGTAGPASSNPLKSPFNINVSVPEVIEIRMVDASALADYEIWFSISSLLASAVTGFLVAYIQGRDSNAASTAALGYMTLILGVLFLISLTAALVKRSILRKKGRTIKLRATEELVE